MKIILETDRLILRTFTPDDAKMFFELCSDPKVLEFTGEKPLKSEKEALQVLTEKILKNQYEKSGFGRWAAHLKKNGLFIGWCGLKEENGEIDLGYRLRKRFWGKGFATEAAKAVLDYGFEELQLEKIHAKCMAENAASVRVMEKAGMTFNSEISFSGKPGVRYEMTRNEWKVMKSSAEE